ncbi:UNVERIFIED_CONTAM: hypothetical protein Cloal_1292 [Acetivibrio alkalicellulosi]
MKKNFIKRSTCFTLIILLSVMCLNAFVNADSLRSTFIYEDISEEIPAVTLGKSVDINYIQSANITPIERSVNIPKEFIFVLDSSLAMVDPDLPEVLFKHTLFSRSYANFQGGPSDTTIEGDTFIKENLNNTMDRNKLRILDKIAEDGTVESPGLIFYSGLTQGDWNKPTVESGRIVSEGMTEAEKDIFKSQYDHLFEPLDADNSDPVLIDQLIANIQSNAAKLHDRLGAMSYFSVDQFRQNPLDSESPIDTSKVITLENNIQMKAETVKRDDDTEPKDYLVIFGNSEFIIRSDMYFDSNLIISVPGMRKSEEIITDGESPETAFVLVSGNIILEGAQAELSGQIEQKIKDIYLISHKGYIRNSVANTDFSGLLLAPQGNIYLGGDSSNYTGSIIGQTLNITAPATFKGPSEKLSDDITGRLPQTSAIHNIKNILSNYVENSLGEETKAGVILYSNKASVLAEVSDDFSNISNKILQIETDNEDLILSNLGDGLRLAYNSFESSISEKYIIVFTARQPNAYSTINNLPVGTHPVNTNELFFGTGSNYYSSSQTRSPGYSGNYWPDIYTSNVMSMLSDDDINVALIDISSSVDEDLTGLALLTESYVKNNLSISNYHKLDGSNSLPSILETFEPSDYSQSYKPRDLELNNLYFSAELKKDLKIFGAEITVGDQPEPFIINSSNIDLYLSETENANVFTYSFDPDDFSVILNENTYLINKINILLKATIIPDNLHFESTASEQVATIILDSNEENAKHAYAKYTFTDKQDNSFTEEHIAPFEDKDITIKHSIDIN